MPATARATNSSMTMHTPLAFTPLGRPALQRPVTTPLELAHRAASGSAPAAAPVDTVRSRLRLAKARLRTWIESDPALREAFG